MSECIDMMHYYIIKQILLGYVVNILFYGVFHNVFKCTFLN